MVIQEGSIAPDFNLSSFSTEEGENKISLTALKGHIVILAFYPKDDTPGCTKEMCAFRDDWKAFSDRGIKVYGVSKDSIASHEKFANKYSFSSLELLSDSDGEMSKSYGVGEDFPSRTLFVVDKNGKIVKIIEGMPRNDELLEFVSGL
jgi:peroxiredoxin Q/BCP